MTKDVDIAALKDKLAADLPPAEARSLKKFLTRLGRKISGTTPEKCKP